MKRQNELTIDAFIKKYMSFFSKYAMTEMEIRGGYNSELINGPIYVKDYVWNLFQRLLHETAKNAKSECELFAEHRDIYMYMVIFRRRHDKVKANDLLQIVFDLDIKLARCSSVVMMVAIISGSCCEFCNSLNNKMYSIEDALANKYLGSKNCSNSKGCNCTYSFVGQRNSNGRLIIKT